MDFSEEALQEMPEGCDRTCTGSSPESESKSENESVTKRLKLSDTGAGCSTSVETAKDKRAVQKRVRSLKAEKGG